MSYKPRVYQHNALSKSVDRLKAGVNKQLVAHATGLGKGFLLTQLRTYHKSTKKMMILLHRDELATQLYKKFKKFNPKLRVGIEMGNSYARPSDEIIIASVPTIGRENSGRLNIFKPEDFDILAIDECHHSAGASYKRILAHFDLLDTPGHKSKSKTLLFGLTATPNRSDNQGLGQIFDEIIDQFSILDAIKDGWLVNIKASTIITGVKIDKAIVGDGDGINEALGKVVNTSKRNRQIVERWLIDAKQGSGYRQTVVFCASVSHAKEMAAAFCAYGITSKAIWSGDKNRSQTLADYEAGKYPVICNVGILTEGWDDPNTSCIILARPSKSQLVFIQQVGRGLRLPDGVNNILEAIKAGNYTGKVDCLVIDVVDNCSSLSLVSLNTLFGLPPNLNMAGKTITEVIEKLAEVEEVRPYIDLSTLESISQLEMKSVDLFVDKVSPEVKDNTKLKWTKINDDEYQILLPNNEKVTVFHDLLADWTAVGTVKGNQFFQDGINSLQEAFRLADNFIIMFGKDLLAILRREIPKSKPKVEAKFIPATQPQKDYLKRLYKNNPKVLGQLNTISKAQASELMRSFTTGK